MNANQNLRCPDCGRNYIHRTACPRRDPSLPVPRDHRGRH